ncbi:HNH endonuclease [Micromonospora carbonacea]|uniref:HNH endonuclease n=1 Tax=Micromonospora carbonacea TaxID=47853 RepID=UPI0037137C6E
MERRTPIARMSAKRRAAFAEQGNPNPFSTLTNGAAVGRGMSPRLAAPAPKRRPGDTGPTAATVALAWQRDGGRCVRCGGVLTGVRGLDFSVQHRRARGAGGTTRSDTNQAHNLIVLCGSATTGCHHHVERHRAEAREFGWAIRQADDPAAMPVLHAAHGWVLLTVDGAFNNHTPNRDLTYQEAI